MKRNREKTPMIKIQNEEGKIKKDMSEIQKIILKMYIPTKQKILKIQTNF